MLVALSVENDKLANSLKKYLDEHFDRRGLKLEIDIAHQGDRIPLIKTGLRDMFELALKNAKTVRYATGATVGIGIAHGPVKHRMSTGAREVHMDAAVICAVATHFIVAVIPDHMHPKEWDKDLSDTLDVLAVPHEPEPGSYDDPIIIETGDIGAQLVAHIIRIEGQTFTQELFN